MKKQLIAAVGALALTFAAVSSVQTTYAESSVGAEVEVVVQVVGEAPSVEITTPEDNAIFYTPDIDVSTTFGHATQIEYKLVYTDVEGNETEYAMPTNAVAEPGTGLKESGIDKFTFDIADYGGLFGDYVLQAQGDGTATTTDLTSFTYRALKLEDTGKLEDGTNNPIVKLTHGRYVDHAKVQVFDKNGKAILEEPIEVKFDGTDGSEEVTLPLAKYGVADDTYTVVATPYDEEEEILDINATEDVAYSSVKKPDEPTTDDPKIDIPIEPGTEVIEVCVKDKNGKPVACPIEILVPNPKPDGWKPEIPFKKYNIPEGEYTIEVVEKDKDGNILKKLTAATIQYVIIPDVPNTGIFGTKIGLSSTDYLASLSVVFLAALMLFFAVMKRGKKSDKRAFAKRRSRK